MRDPDNRPGPLACAVILLALAGVMASLRLRTFDEPLEFDLTLYATVGHEMLLGRKLYSEIWDQKPPAIHTTYMLAEAAFGYGPRAVYALNVTAAVWTLLAVFAAGCAFPPGRLSGLWAALFWTLVSDNITLQANQPNTEVFMNAFTATAFALWLRARRGPGVVRVVIAGLCVALATMYKQVIVAPALLWAAVDVALPPEGTSRVRRLLAAVGLVLVVAGAWVALAAYFSADGRWSDFYDTVVLYNRNYAGDGPIRNLIFAFRPYRFLGPFVEAAPLTCLLVAAGATTALLMRDAPARPWALWTAYAAGAWVAVHAPGKGFPHYFQLLLPPLAIAAGASVGQLRATFSAYATPFRPWLGAVARVGPLALAVVAALQLAYGSYHSYRHPAHEWARRKYGFFFHDVEALGRKIGELLKPDETLFVFGDVRPGLYWFSQRRPAAGVLFNDPLLGGPIQERMIERTLKQLKANPPEIVVFAVMSLNDDRAEYYVPAQPVDATKHPVSAWVLEHYERRSDLELTDRANRPDRDAIAMQVYVRKGGRLQATGK